jgi:hypothetical protein
MEIVHGVARSDRLSGQMLPLKMEYAKIINNNKLRSEGQLLASFDY